MLTAFLSLILVAAGDHPDHHPAPQFHAFPATAGQLPQSTLPPVREDYATCYARAMLENKPLVAWVGGGDAVCPACVNTLKDEAVHYIGPLEGIAGQALVVMVPENGRLMTVSTITRWTTGDANFGHTASIRRAIRTWRERRHVTLSGWSMEPPVVASPPVMMYRPQQMMMRRGGG